MPERKLQSFLKVTLDDTKFSEVVETTENCKCFVQQLSLPPIPVEAL